MVSRKNAMPTTEDRRWLTGEKTYDGQHAKRQRYQRRNDVRDRVYDSVLDFTILFWDLEEDERRKIFGEVTDDGSQWVDADEEFRDGVRDALAFLLRGIGVRTLVRESADESSPHVAEQFLALATARAGQREGFLVDDVELDVEGVQECLRERVLADDSGGA
ncbi:response regulator [Halorarum salinum]|uniref:Domain of unknown function domain-containing protein n=1 Tax=Halorarum salinum TaxID=2743089 RepID=A0A7D5L959_9EURY|nr:hypothetical protein [Halobaculum salinum]QLG61246.1 hypothetical protein HUG12_05655 [Halobaculum salinum]